MQNAVWEEGDKAKQPGFADFSLRNQVNIGLGCLEAIAEGHGACSTQLREEQAAS